LIATEPNIVFLSNYCCRKRACR